MFLHMREEYRMTAEEIEQEVETSPGGNPYPTVREVELEQEVSEKERALEELRKEVKALRELVPENTKDPDMTRRIQESFEKLKEENLELKAALQAEQKYTKASDIPKTKDIQPFLIKREQISNLWKILGKSFNHDIQAFLCEESWLHVIPPFEMTYTDDTQRDYAQRFEELSLRNASQTRQEQGQESAPL